ncbi:dethiobiotin synthetase [Kitasatospora sp. MAP12-15]|uniref:dethiobiotin synthase n=1 Tax=unclassified Kitasatospora TaxID=2633591 RepID=UPI0024744E08|nr:dethiobiotin synthase [Kitasatospora sp. MAP12-44]MDH6114693.1 dethiobiotin synthetase [Kitasatospora sp. MAP12-44]
MTLLFVTGTGTEVGKTAVTAAIAALAVRAGRSTAVLKPGQTGVGATEPGDAEEVVRLVGAPLTTRELVRYPEPLAPETAALRSGLPYLTTRQFASAVDELTDHHELTLVEGAGGLLVRYDRDGLTLADLARASEGAEVLLVVAAGLGTLNATTLTAEALRARGLRLAGLVIGSWPAAPDLATRCNLADLPTAAGAPLLGALPAGVTATPGAAFAELAAASLAPALGGHWDAAAFAEQHRPDQA